MLSVRLTPKELQIVSGVCAGKMNKEIAYSMGTSEQVVKNYLRRIYKRANVRNRYELIINSTMPHETFDPNAVDVVSFTEYPGKTFVKSEDFLALKAIYSDALVEINRLRIQSEVIAAQ